MFTLFNSLFDDVLFSRYETESPRWERLDKGWRLKIAVPGVKKEEIGIKASQGWVRIEAPGRSVKFGMPRLGDHERLEASLDLGVLEITLPDSGETGVREIKIS